MYSEKYEKSYQTVMDGIACKNAKPISCITGWAPYAQMDGMTVAEYVADPVAGVKAAQRTIQRIEEEAGPAQAGNAMPTTMNAVVGITFAWNSRVLKPGIDISENSVWQVKEEKLIERDAYDQILEMGYNNFVQQNIIPRVIELDYLGKYLQIAGEYGEWARQVWIEQGICAVQTSNANPVPFEQLCGMRSLQQFYKDCYKIPEKLKEVSDFIFAETAQAKAAEYEAAKDDRTYIGAWVGGWRTASAMLNPKIWELLVWPYMKASGEQLLEYGKVPVFHLDQDWNRDIERFSELPAGKIIINTDSMTVLPVARKKLPGYALMGDVPPQLFTAGTPEDVSEYVKRLIDEVGPEGLFVTAGCDLPVGAKYDNVVAMIKTTNEWQ